MTGYLNQQHITSIILKEQLRARRLLHYLTRAILILLFAALLLNAGLHVAKQFPVFYHVTPTTVTVSAGSTLWEIAGQYIGEYPGTVNGYINEICRLNNIQDPSLIHSGTELTVPIYHCKLS